MGWKENVNKNILKYIDIEKFQRECSVDIYKFEPSDTYNFEDFEFAYEIEKQNNANFSVTGAITTKLLYPFIYKMTNNELKSQREEIITDCYIEIVTHMKNLDMENIKQANNPQATLCGYFKLYCQSIISDYSRNHIDLNQYKKGIRQAEPFSTFLGIYKTYNDDAIVYKDDDTSILGFFSPAKELKSPEDVIKDKRNLVGLYAWMYSLHFNDFKGKSINTLLSELDTSNLSQQSKDTIISRCVDVVLEGNKHLIKQTKEPKQIKLSKNESKPGMADEYLTGRIKEDVSIFNQKFVAKLNETQLDAIIKKLDIYKTLEPILNKYGIIDKSSFSDNPFEVSYKNQKTSWENLVTTERGQYYPYGDRTNSTSKYNKYSKTKSKLKELDFSKSKEDDNLDNDITDRDEKE